jgi:hypothetical protein
MAEITIDAFIKRCDEYCAARQPPLSRARLSTLLFNDGKRIDAIESGSDVGHRRLTQAVSDLAALEASRAEAGLAA